MLNGIAVIEPATTTEFPEVLQLGLELVDADVADGGGVLKRLCKGEHIATWRVAIGATISGLKNWCEPVDITTALMWVQENLDRMFSEPTPYSPN